MLVLRTISSPFLISLRRRNCVSRWPAITQLPFSPGNAVPARWPGPRRNELSSAPSTTYHSPCNLGIVSFATVSPVWNREWSSLVGAGAGAGREGAGTFAGGHVL